MSAARSFLLGLTALALLLQAAEVALSQPFLREADPDDNQQEHDAEEIKRRDLSQEKARLEEEQGIKLQQELMRLQGEQMLAEQEEIRRRDRMMRYALIIAVAVIAVTLLIAYTRSRVENDGKPPKTPE